MCNSEGLDWVKPRASKKFHSCIICLVAKVAVMYSTSIDDKATMDCFLEVHDIAPLPSKKVYPEIDFQSISFDAQSASKKPEIATVALPPH
jgi:hypothetical protein